MKNGTRASRAKGVFVFSALLAFVLGATTFQVQAQYIKTLTDKNSSAQIRTAVVGSDSAGWYSWTVDGVEQLSQQWFYYRIGNGPQQSIDTLGAPSYIALGANAARLTYANSQYKVSITYMLGGGTTGSGMAGLTQQITVNNLTASSVDFHFYDYSDFNVSGTAADQSVLINVLPTYAEFVQSDLGPGLVTSRVQGPGIGSLSHWKADTFNSTLTALQTVNGLVLNDATSAGPGNVTAAFQWDAILDPKGSITGKDALQLSKTLTVPEPSTVVLLALGLLALAARRKG